VAQSPFLMGAGIDEDTALVVHGTQSIEVLGEGCVTILDCRNAHSNVTEIEPGQLPQLSNALLHLLPTGIKCQKGNASQRQAPIAEFIDYLANRTRTA
jgi:cyanophycinase